MAWSARATWSRAALAVGDSYVIVDIYNSARLAYASRALSLKPPRSRSQHSHQVLLQQLPHQPVLLRPQLRLPSPHLAHSRHLPALLLVGPLQLLVGLRRDRLTDFRESSYLFLE